MKFYPGSGTKTWEDCGAVYAEWSDRVVDDEDRYADDSIILTVMVKHESQINRALQNAYDKYRASIE